MTDTLTHPLRLAAYYQNTSRWDQTLLREALAHEGVQFRAEQVLNGSPKEMPEDAHRVVHDWHKGRYSYAAQADETNRIVKRAEPAVLRLGTPHAQGAPKGKPSSGMPPPVITGKAGVGRTLKVSPPRMRGADIPDAVEMRHPAKRARFLDGIDPEHAPRDKDDGGELSPVKV